MLLVFCIQAAEEFYSIVIGDIERNNQESFNEDFLLNKLYVQFFMLVWYVEEVIAANVQRNFGANDYSLNRIKFHAINVSWEQSHGNKN